MKVLGKIEFFYKDNFAIIKLIDRKIAFKLGYNVYGPDLSLLGKALDVLGPAEEPRIFVRLLRRPKFLKEEVKVYFNPKELSKK